MITISIQKPKSSQMNRVMKGCGMRVVEGDYPVQVKKELARKIKNAFSKGKAHTLYSHEFEGTGLNDIYKKAKKAVSKEVKQTVKEVGKEAKREAYRVGRELKKEAIQTGNVFIEDVARPYVKELVTAGIVGLGGAAALLQPEIAPFIGVGTLAASSYASSLIDSIGRPKPRPKPEIYEYDYANEYVPPSPQIQAEVAQPVHEVIHTPMRSVSDSQQSLIGYGLRNTEKKGNGLFAGGGLYTHGRGLHPSLQEQNPSFYLNRNILPAYIQNSMY
jgi:hypothetical protein